MSAIFTLLFYPASISKKALGALQYRSKKNKTKISVQRTKDRKQKIKGGGEEDKSITID